MDSEPFPLSNSLCITHWENYRSQTLPTDSTDQPFFKGDVVSIEKTPKRATAGLDPSFAQFYERLVQGQIRLFGHHGQNLRRKYFQRRDAPAAGFRRGAPSAATILPPTPRSPRNIRRLHGATHPPRRPRSRVPAGHQNRPSASQPPVKANQYPKTRSSLML